MVTSTPVHRALFAVDIEHSADLRRHNNATIELRRVLYDRLGEAFQASGIDWASCTHHNTGDGLVVAVPPQFPKRLLLHPVLDTLAMSLRRHNRKAPEAEQIRVRVAVHDADVRVDAHGVSGRPMIRLARLLEAQPLRDALATAPQTVTVVAILSDRMHEDVVCQGYPDIDPEHFTRVDAQVKETHLTGWLYIPNYFPPTDLPATVPASALGRLRGGVAARMRRWRRAGTAIGRRALEAVRRHPRRNLAIGVIVLAASAAAIRPYFDAARERTPSTPSTTGQLSGDILIDGSTRVLPLTEQARILFSANQPGVRVTALGPAGTNGGFEKFCNGETDISDAAWPIKDKEKAACEAKGISYGELHVANDYLTVVVNKDVDFTDCLTVDQLKMIWGPDSMVNNWNQIDPSFPSKPLRLFGPGPGTGTFEYFTTKVNGEESAIRRYYSTSAEPDIAQGVSGFPGAMGYFAYAHFEDNQNRLKALQIDGGGGCVTPSAKAAQDGSYTPLARPLFLYTSVPALLSKPQVAAFVEYCVANVETITKTIAKEERLVPLTADQKSELKADFERLKSGGAS
jgi:phosphate transport system substrate-binding protein